MFMFFIFGAALTFFYLTFKFGEMKDKRNEVENQAPPENSPMLLA